MVTLKNCTCFGLILLLNCCKTIKPSQLESSMADQEVEEYADPSIEHPCSIAGQKTDFEAPFFPIIDDPDQSLGRRDWSVIRSQAMLSRLAYETSETIQKTARKWGYKTIDVTVDGAMQAFVASNDNCIVLAFRGTDMNSLKDWFVDGSASRRAVEGGLIHAGFYSAYMSMAERLQIQLKAHQVQQKKFWITGHSLGGALAGVFAYSNNVIANRKDYKIDRIVTFGQPLFVDSLLAKAMRGKFVKRYLRVVNNSDIVARVPPWFEHFGALYWLKLTRSEFHPEFTPVGAPPGGDSNPIVIPAKIPDELAPSQSAFEQFLIEAAVTVPPEVIPSPLPKPVGGLQMTDDHSMDLYLDLVTQKWEKVQ